MDARYAFSVRFRLTPTGEVWIEPDTFETRLYRPADPPGQPGWLFFRDNLWRGELADPGHIRDLVDDIVAPELQSVEYRALETDEAYLESLEDEIEANLAEFNAESVTAVVRTYLGSSIEVE